MTEIFITLSPRETQDLARVFLNKFQERNVLCLYGELGAGKTTFVQGLAKGLGIKQVIQSPTFVLMREFKITGKRGQSKLKKVKVYKWKRLVHLDCYRIKSAKDIRAFDLKEIWKEAQSLIVIEWADRIKKILPKKRVDIYFEHKGEQERKIRLENSN